MSLHSVSTRTVTNEHWHCYKFSYEFVRILKQNSKYVQKTFLSPVKKFIVMSIVNSIFGKANIWIYFRSHFTCNKSFINKLILSHIVEFELCYPNSPVHIFGSKNASENSKVLESVRTSRKWSIMLLYKVTQRSWPHL